MKASILLLSARFSALELRERVLILGAALAVVWLLWDLTVHSVGSKALAKSRRGVDQVVSRIKAETREQTLLRETNGMNPLQSLQKQEARLQAEIEEIESLYAALLGEFVHPERMPALLEDMLERHPGLKLVELRSLPPEPVLVGEDQEQVQGIFLHPLEIRFRGGFFGVIDYLNALQSLEWDFVWRSIDYEVVDYPHADVVLTVETLGREEDWLGV